MSASEDEHYMAEALCLAKHGLGCVWPNPSVGCMIVDMATVPPRILGRGWTQPGGCLHAESVALGEAGESARGATLYVTLEPCAHYGRTPPCVDRIISAGIGRVVSAMSDPDPRVNGKGHACLLAAGITLEQGVLEAAAHRLNIGHLRRVLEKRPFVQLKLAHCRNGSIARAGNHPLRITAGIADSYVHHMRAKADAIMVGAGTLSSDDPELTCRIPGTEGRSPVRIVLDRDLNAGLSSRLFQTAGKTPSWIVTGQCFSSERTLPFTEKGVRVLMAKQTEQRKLDLDSVLRLLANEGITRLLVEGGASLAHSFLTSEKADEIILIEGNIAIDCGGLPAFTVAGPELVAQNRSYSLSETRALGQDTLRRYVKRI